jgi:phosphatidate cytidylyltransferase
MFRACPLVKETWLYAVEVSDIRIIFYVCTQQGIINNRQKQMNNFLQRTVYGFVFLVLVVGSVLVSPLVFALLMAIANLIGMKEMLNLFQNRQEAKSYFAPYFYVAGSIFFILMAVVGLGFLPVNYLLLLAVVLLFPFLHALFSKKLNFNEVFSMYYASYFFVNLPSSLLLFFFNSDIMGDIAGPILLLSMLFMIWINDTFAYIIGVWLGKHRLFERISPKKSWEGSFGGLFFTLLASFFWAHFTGFMPVAHMLGMAFTVVVFGSFGDLIESMIKRQSGVKDAGNLIPGHGGVLDRFDATFFATPFVFVYLLML